jgi:hypothetical protein|tara:strand:- start:4609 stop:4851 length:243 start_codon:yes stop_codon:yes gene_type:complete
MKTFKEFESFFDAHPDAVDSHPTERVGVWPADSIRPSYADTRDTPSMLDLTDKELEKQKEKKKKKDRIIKKSRRYLPDEE